MRFVTLSRESGLTLDFQRAVELAENRRREKFLLDHACRVVRGACGTGWHFYYQRAAALATQGNVSTPQIEAVPKSLKHKLRKALSMDYKVKPKLTVTTVRQSILANHVLTACADLPFNVVA